MDPKDMPSISQIPAKNFLQTIKFKSSDSEYTCQIVAQDVIINCSTGNHNHGSSKVKLTNVVDYNWEQKYYPGHLLSVHVSGKYFAYAIKVGKNSGMVRVATHDSQMRALIKEMNGQVQDISFAHILNNVNLACVDEEGTLFVYNIEETKDKLICTLNLHIIQTERLVHGHGLHRVVWCPYLPDDDDGEEEASKLLALTHENKAQLLNVSIIHSINGVGPLPVTSLHEGYLEIDEHSKPILDAAFSPDGTAVATASLDGYVKFFQIYMHEGTKPRCLHKWQPHEGKPLSWLSFLDNHSIYGADEQFWKFALTGCNNNTEIRIWSCEYWTCLQTIQFIPNPSSPCLEMFLQVRLDITAGYLLISDINNRIFYILEMHKDSTGSNAYARSISEFLLPASVLSFGTLEAAVRNFRCNSTEDLYPCDDSDDFDETIAATVIRMYVIQPKRLQECQIVFQNNSGRLLVESEDDTSEKETTPSQKSNQLSDILQADKYFNDLTLLVQKQPLNLMTPSAFSSSTQENPEPEPSPLLIKMNSPNKDSESTSNGIINFRTQKDFTSGGSSPSREVQEILSLNNSSFGEFYEDEAKPDAISSMPDTTQEDTYQTLNADGWPKIPILKAQDVVKKEGKKHSKEEWDRNKVHTEQKGPTVDSLQAWVELLSNMNKEQNEEIQELQNEIKTLKMVQNTCNVSDSFEKAIEKRFELAFAKSTAQQIKQFESWANARNIRDREHYESLTLNITHQVTKQVTEKLHSIVQLEMKQSVLPKVVSTLDSIKAMVEDEISKKLKNAEMVIRENLTQFISSKMVADSISDTVVNGLRPTIENSYRQIISTNLVPSWERVCNNLFQQVQETFGQGTKEYTCTLENYLEQSRKHYQDQGSDLLLEMQTVFESVNTNIEKLYHNMPLELQQQVVTCKNSMVEQITSNMVEIVKSQIEIAFKHHASVLEDSFVHGARSRAGTPAPVVDTQMSLTSIQKLLSQGFINTAFQNALSAADLNLVMYICERLNPHRLFSQTPCPLQQHVLLSLVQQLSADMSTMTDLKLNYLEEAVLNLDQHAPVTKEHSSAILEELLDQLALFLEATPKHKLARKIKMLQLATQSLLKN